MGGLVVSATTSTQSAGSQQVFLLPDLGEGLTEAELVRWLVSEGDTLVIDQPIAEVETAKSLVEVPSPFAGVVAILHGSEGQLMDVGKPFLTVSRAIEAGGTGGTGEAGDPHESYREEERAGSGNVLIGYGTSGHTATARSRPRKAEATPAAPALAAAVGAGSVAPLVISPLVRKLARDSGISLHSVTGSGPGGLILRQDLQLTGAAATATSSKALEGTAGLDPRSGLSVLSRTPLTGIRKAIAANLSRSRTEIPEATVWVDVDATALLQMRDSLKKVNPESTPGILAFIARFVLAGLARFPELNTRIENGEIVAVDGVNLGFAAQTERSRTGR